MQIFVTDKCPTKSALRLWNSPNRARKMITEYQQILACCQHEFNGKVTIKKVDGTPFKTPKSRMNHPVIIWARKSKNNMKWVAETLESLYLSYEGNGFVNVEDNIDILNEELLFVDMTTDNFCNFAKSSDKGLDFTNLDDTIEAYDKFLKAQGA